MNRLSVRCVAAGLVAAAFLPFAASASERQLAEEIVVQSQAPVATEVGKTFNGFPIVLVEARHSVRIDELDLTTDAGTDSLVKLVRAVARKSCSRLDAMFPYANPSPSCVRDAVAEVMPQIEAAVAEAKSQGVASLTARN
jgi:UrcA family protein